MKILFFAIEFAPLNTTGNYRSLKFVKYLPEFGIEPVVITVDQESGIRMFGNRIDLKLLDEIGVDTFIYRIPAESVPTWIINNKILNFLRIYFNTDDKIAQKWRKGIKANLNKIIAQHQPKAIYISLPPFSGHHLVDFLKKETSLPIIVDMRDLWSQWSISPWQSWLHYKNVLMKEQKLFQQASKIIGVTPQLVEVFKETHPNVPQEKFEVIYNGHDIDLNFSDSINIPSLHSKDKIIIGYIGSFYYNPKANEDRQKKWWKRPPHKWLYYAPVKEDWSYRSPLYFIKTLSHLLQENPKLRTRIIFEHVGKCPAWLPEMLEKYGVDDVFHSHGFVSYQEVLKIQQGFDFFLSTSEKVEGKEHYCLPSKTFDYLKEEKPILGFLTPGIQREFLPKIGFGILFDPDNIKVSSEKLEQVLKGDFELTIQKDYILSFHRKNLTAQLATIIKDVIRTPIKLAVENV